MAYIISCVGEVKQDITPVSRNDPDVMTLEREQQQRQAEQLWSGLLEEGKQLCSPRRDRLLLLYTNTCTSRSSSMFIVW